MRPDECLELLEAMDRESKQAVVSSICLTPEPSKFMNSEAPPSLDMSSPLTSLEKKEEEDPIMSSPTPMVENDFNVVPNMWKLEDEVLNHMSEPKNREYLDFDPAT